MKKRVLSLLMSFVLVISLLPATIRAAEPTPVTAEVYVTISVDGQFAAGKDGTPMGAVPITAANRNSDGSINIDEVLYAAHEAYYVGGAAEGYGSASGYFGLSLTKLWGDQSGAFGYYKNNNSCWSLADEVSAGDCITAFVYKDKSYYSDIYSYFDVAEKTVAVGNPTTLKLCYNTYDENYHAIPTALSGATVTVAGAEQAEKTNDNGEIALTFSNVGSYVVSAAKTVSTTAWDYGTNTSVDVDAVLVPPLCVVTVLSEADYADYRSVLNAAKSQLTWDILSNEPQYALTTAPTLPSTLTAEGKTVSVSWASTNSALSIAHSDGAWSAYMNRHETRNATGDLTATFTYATASDTKIFPITVKAENSAVSADLDALTNTIAAANTNAGSDWWVMDMGAYTAAYPNGAKLTEDAKQNYINLVVSTLESGKNSYGYALGDTDYDKMILALTAIGADAQQVYPVNSNTPLSLIEKLNGVSHSASAWSAPYTLAAYNQRDYANTETYERTLINALLESQKADGSWDEWGTIDTTANVIAGLSFYADETAVKAAIDKGVSYLATQMHDNGTYDGGYGENTNSTAMVIIGLAAAGVNPDTNVYFIKNDVSVLDGLLSYALADNSGFGYANNTTKDDYATEQAFRALIAATQVMTTGKAYNIYDFSANTIFPARATGKGEAAAPSAPTGDEITVRVTVKADTGYWLRGKSVTLSGEGAKVYHAFIQALEGSGITQIGAADGYVRSMTRNGRTLAEFTNGENSGWLYKVNGELPNVGLTARSIQDGDHIVFYYTNDWTRDPDAGSMSGAVQPETNVTLAPSVTVSNGAATAAVSSKELGDALSSAEQNGESTVTIAPALRTPVDAVTVTLPLSAAAAAAKQGVQLVIDAGTAQVTLNAEVLTELSKTGGTELTIEISTESSADLSSLPQDKLADAVIAQITVTIGGEKVTTFGGKTLTVELPVDKDSFRIGANVPVYLFSDNGSVERTTGLCVEKNGERFVRVETTHLSTFVVLREEALPFADVSDTAWYADAVRYAYAHQLMTGVSSDSFLPDGTTTRAQLVTILHRLAGYPVVNYLMPFTDVSEDIWYAEAVRWAASEGIVTGCDDGSFRPDDAVTREQLAAILYRYVCAQGCGFTGMWYFPLRYEDAGAVSAWANEAMHWCVMRGILTGTSATTLEPSASATRSQLAAILQRFCTLDTADTLSAAERAYQSAAAYLAAAVPAPTVSSIGGEWTVLALARGGETSNPAALNAYQTTLEQTLHETDGVLSERKYTEYSRVILALSALGEDARSFAGYDLTLPLADYDKTVAQGVNGAIFALLALDSADYPMPHSADASAQATREMYVEHILSAQRTDGGWSLKSDAVSADPDLTAMALQALAAYRDRREVGEAITAALDCLSVLQNADGGFSASGAANAESCAQILLALNALGIDTDDARFVKNGSSALDALLTFQAADGSFRHIAGGETNLMASEQAACALAALLRAERGESSFYCMNSTAAAKAA